MTDAEWLNELRKEGAIASDPPRPVIRVVGLHDGERMAIEVHDDGDLEFTSRRTHYLTDHPEDRRKIDAAIDDALAEFEQRKGPGT